jgi:hypothetical protein
VNEIGDDSARYIYLPPALLDPIKYGSEGPLDPLDHYSRTDRIVAAPYLTLLNAQRGSSTSLSKSSRPNGAKINGGMGSTDKGLMSDMKTLFPLRIGRFGGGPLLAVFPANSAPWVFAPFRAGNDERSVTTDLRDCLHCWPICGVF